MHLDALLWMFLPLIVAGGSALLAFYIMHARMEVAVAKERETLAVAEATLHAQKATMEERIKATEESTRRATMDQLMQEFRMEERSYVRESSSEDSSKRTMVMQERMFFRNLPLSDWMEHEIVVEDNRGASKAGAALGASHASVTPGQAALQAALRETQAVNSFQPNLAAAATERGMHANTASAPHFPPAKSPVVFNQNVVNQNVVNHNFGNPETSQSVAEVSTETLAALNRALTAAGRPLHAEPGTNHPSGNPSSGMSRMVVSEAALATLDSAVSQKRNATASNLVVMSSTGATRPLPAAPQETALALALHGGAEVPEERRKLAVAFGAQ